MNVHERPAESLPGRTDVPGLCVLGCSPRAGGSSDTVARLAGEAADMAGLSVERLFLRDFAIRPCVSCGHCLEHPDVCPLDDGDDVGVLFARLRSADALLIAAPVYFYGPPAQFKALIDRAQRFWKLPALPPLRPALVALCAGRTTGERLFEASLLILRCFLRAMGRESAPPLLLRGMDTVDDVARCPEIVRQAKKLGEEAARLVAPFHATQYTGSDSARLQKAPKEKYRRTRSG